jgi:ABC-type multidrug transport system fused ATPase/permease subunit
LTEQESLDAGFGFRQNSWKAFLFTLPFLKPYLPRVIAICFIDLAIMMVNLVIPWLGKFIIDDGFAQRDWLLVLQLAVTVIVLTGAAYGLSGVRTFLYTSTDMLLGLEIRRVMYRHIQKISLESVEAMAVGPLQFRTTTDADRIAHMLVRILPTATMLVEFGLLLAAAVYVDPLMTLVVLGFLVPWTVLFIWVTGYGRTLDRRRLFLIERRDAGLLQAAASFPAIKALGRQGREIRRHLGLSTSVQRVANQGYLILVFFEFATQRLIPFLKQTTIFLYLARKVVWGEMTLGMTAPMIAYLGRLTYPIERIVNFGCWIWQTMVSAERMMQILTTEPAVKEADGAVELKEFSGRLTFENVSYDRPEVGRVINGVSITLEPGKFIAVVGPSGAGKSTLASLALRLADPVEGRVCADGHDLRTLLTTPFLRQVATVTQQTFIFGGTLADNLRLAQPSATDSELRDALEKVALTEWLDSLPDGLEQDLQGGLGLSGGQCQRLGIARAYLCQAKLLVLDEPTSALDSKTEEEVMRHLAELRKGRTTLMVTHRFDTVIDADHIIVLDKGRVIEEGHHDQLMQLGGVYAELVRLHNSHPPQAESIK